MKEFKIIMLVATLGFGTSLTATTKSHDPLYPNSVKGGLQTSQKYEPVKQAVPGIHDQRDPRAGKKLKIVKFLSRCNKK